MCKILYVAAGLLVVAPAVASSLPARHMGDSEPLHLLRIISQKSASLLLHITHTNILVNMSMCYCIVILMQASPSVIVMSVYM